MCVSDGDIAPQWRANTQQATSRLHVTICLVTYSLNGGGAEKQLLLIARALAASGMDCGIYALSVPCGEVRYETLLASCREAGVAVHLPSRKFGIVGIIADLTYAALKGRSETVLWTWGYRAEALRLAIPLLWLARGVFSIRSASESQLLRWRWLLRFGRPLTWRYVSNSHLGIRLAETVAPGIAQKARVVLNAMETSSLSAPIRAVKRPDVLRVMMLGNVRYLVKGYDIALDVAHAIRVGGLPIQIHVGGAQLPGEPQLAEQIKREGLVRVMVWDGSVSAPGDFLRSGHVFMLLSRYEGMPNALFEAMAVGLPCIATAVGDLPRIARESHCLRVIPVENAQAAFTELRRLWENWQEALEMGQRAHEFCRSRFSEEATVVSVRKALAMDHTIPE